MYIWEVVAWEIAHFESCHLGKYPLEVATWEKAFGKVPNISQMLDHILKPFLIKHCKALFSDTVYF